MQNYYAKQLLHSSTADIEKRKALISNIKSAETQSMAVNEKTGQAAKNKKDLRDPSTLTDSEKKQLSDASNAISDSHKALANHDWYVHNKEWKKEYNQEYYQNNKDYWKKRSEEAQSRWDKYEDANSPDEIKDVTGARMDAYSAKINYERAQKEYDNFMNSTAYKEDYSTKPYTALSQPYGTSLIDKGVKALASIAGPILGALAKLFS